MTFYIYDPSIGCGRALPPLTEDLRARSVRRYARKMSDFLKIEALPHTDRGVYLASLPEPQEWFLEELVRSGEVWLASGEAYAVFSGDTLVEFHAVRHADAPNQLRRLCRQRPFKKALAKSFDQSLMQASRALGWDQQETGFLFRKRTEAHLSTPNGFELEQAKLRDLEGVWEAGRDFYVDLEEVKNLFHAGGLWVARQATQLVGSGVAIPIDASGDVMDVGMVVEPRQRNKGYASLIITQLANSLEDTGKRAICGCSERNLASKKALQNAGFVSDHRLVQIHVAE